MALPLNSFIEQDKESGNWRAVAHNSRCSALSGDQTRNFTSLVRRVTQTPCRFRRSMRMRANAICKMCTVQGRSIVEGFVFYSVLTACLETTLKLLNASTHSDQGIKHFEASFSENAYDLDVV